MTDEEPLGYVAELGLRLQECRLNARMTQKEAAIASGVGWKTISSYETGKRAGSMKLEHLKRLLNAYSVDFDAFFSVKTLDDAYMESLGGKVVAEILRSVGALRDPWRASAIRSINKLLGEAKAAQRRCGVSNARRHRKEAAIAPS